MFYIIRCYDKPGHQEVRLANRAAHLAYLDGYGDRVYAAGPVMSDDLQSMVGSLIVLDLPDRAAAEGFCVDDPYARAGLFERVEIAPWKRVYPRQPA